MIVESISRFARSTHDLLEKVQMVLRGEKEADLNRISHQEIDTAIQNADGFLKEKGLTALT